MGEIKSALELAMEKSKKYLISREEKEKFKQEEILQKASGLFHRYREGHLSLHEIEREIGRMDGKTQERVKEALLSQWIESLSLEGDSERILRGIELIQNRDLNEITVRFESLLSEYGKAIEVARQRKRAGLAEALKKAGIEGDAVEPNLEGDEEWKRLRDSTRHSFEGPLEEIRRSLKAS